jgi:hypothetical protein
MTVVINGTTNTVSNDNSDQVVLQANGTVKFGNAIQFTDSSTQSSAGVSTGKAIAMAIVFG